MRWGVVPVQSGITVWHERFVFVGSKNQVECSLLKQSGPFLPDLLSEVFNASVN